MKKAIFALAAVLVTSNITLASYPEVFPSGPSNLFPTESSSAVILWVGGTVAIELFEGMTAVPIESEDAGLFRFGEHLECYFNPANEILSGCQIKIESATGAASSR